MRTMFVFILQSRTTVLLKRQKPCEKGGKDVEKRNSGRLLLCRMGRISLFLSRQTGRLPDGTEKRSILPAASTRPLFATPLGLFSPCLGVNRPSLGLNRPSILFSPIKNQLQMSQHTDPTTERRLRSSAPAEKRCRKCGETKPQEAFAVSLLCSDGLDSYCRSCRREMTMRRNGGLSHLLSRFTTEELEQEVARRRSE